MIAIVLSGGRPVSPSDPLDTYARFGPERGAVRRARCPLPTDYRTEVEVGIDAGSLQPEEPPQPARPRRAGLTRLPPPARRAWANHNPHADSHQLRAVAGRNVRCGSRAIGGAARTP